MLRPLDDGDHVAPAVQLVRCRQARRARAYHADLLPRPLGRPAWAELPGAKGRFDDAQLIVPDRNGVPIDAADAGVFAGGGAHAAGELRKAVGLQQPAEGVAPVAGEDHVVPLGDQVVQGTAKGLSLIYHPRLAEGDAAVHAPGALLAPDLLRQGKVELLPVPDPLRRGPAAILPAGIFQKAGGFSHVVQPPLKLWYWRRTPRSPPADGSCLSPRTGRWTGASGRSPGA